MGKRNYQDILSDKDLEELARLSIPKRISIKPEDWMRFGHEIVLYSTKYTFLHGY